MIIKINQFTAPSTFWYSNHLGDYYKRVEDLHQDGFQVVDCVTSDEMCGSVKNEDCDQISEGFTVTSDVTQISSVDGVANITITYPDTTVNEKCQMLLEGQITDIQITNGTITFAFTSQVTGLHKLVFLSSSTFGANIIVIEVV